MVSKEFVVSAPGKIILHGEHAVVYGKLAVAAALSLRTTLHIKTIHDKDDVLLHLPDIGVEVGWSVPEIAAAVALPVCDPEKPAPPSEELLQKLKTFASIPHDSADTKTLALVSFLYLYCAIVGSQKTLTPLEIRIESKLPVSAGLGSSAAYSVCLAASLLLHKNLISASGKWSEKDLQLINAWAFQAEKVIHGKPSGIDNSVSTYGHAVSFTKGSEPVILSQVPSIRILLVNTKVPRSTKTLVESVKKKYDKSTVVMSAVMDTMEAVAKECLILFEKMYKGKADEYYKQLEELIYINQQQLDIIGVSHIALEKVIQITKANGLCSKLTGAGGGGCAFALIRPDVPKETLDCVIQQLSLEGFDCWETGIGAEGVTLHV